MTRIPTTRTSTTAAYGRTLACLALGALGLLTACGSDDGASAATIGSTITPVVESVTSTGEWCAVARQMDEVTDAPNLDASSTADELAEAQVAFGTAVQLAAQLETRLDLVDIDHRADVGSTLALFVELATVVVDADDAAALDAAANDIFADADEASLDAANAWLQATCGLDV
jgi:hypothetical protein